MYVNSPFPEENRLLMVAEDVSSRYTRRSRQNTGRWRTISGSSPKAGREIIWCFFLPISIWARFEEILEEEPLKADLLVQGQGMGEAEKAEFLEEFEKERSHSLARLLCHGRRLFGGH